MDTCKAPITLARRRVLIALAVATLLTMATPSAAQVSDTATYTYVLADLLDYQWNPDGANSVRWEGAAWIGRDYDKLWMKSEGKKPVGEAGDAEAQLLYSRMVSPFWNFQTGLRVETRPGADVHPVRTSAVVGFEGLAPYRFDLEPVVFFGNDGSVSARISAAYQLHLTQRLVAQPRFEMNATSRRAEEFDLGSGVTDMSLDWRLRYEIRREFAPYVGVVWDQRFADTADIARRRGKPAASVALVTGVRVWF